MFSINVPGYGDTGGAIGMPKPVGPILIPGGGIAMRISPCLCLLVASFLTSQTLERLIPIQK